MNSIHMYLIFLTWIVTGSLQPVAWSFVAIAIGLIAASVLRHSFHGRAVILLGILGMMFADSLLFVLFSFYSGLLGRTSIHLAGRSPPYFAILHEASLGIVLMGGVAALCTALFVRFKKSHIGMSKMFPRLKFLQTPPAELSETVRRLAGVAVIAPPEVYIADSGVPSAFTVCAKNKYSIALSVGLLESLDDEEIEACIAHEISHLKNGDFVVRLLATLARVALFTKPLSYLIEPAIYRAREFLADKTAAELTGKPDALIHALSKLKDSERLAPMPTRGSVCLCNLSGGGSILRILDKQPDIDTRIQALREMRQA